MSVENNKPAVALIEQLVNNGMTQTEISTKMGYGPWWASGIKTKGDGLSDETLGKLTDLRNKYCKQAAVKSNGRNRRIRPNQSRGLVLSLFKNGSRLSKASIMRKCLGMGMSCGATENTLYALRAAGKLECPVRGHYKLVQKIERTNHSTPSNGNGNVVISARSFKRLMKDVRIMKKLIRQQASSGK